MKIDFPKIVCPIPLSDYALGLTQTLYAWVNPPRSLVEKFSEITKLTGDELDAELLKWHSELLSQGAEETRLSPDDLKSLVEQTKDTDPRFWDWLQERIVDEIVEHRSNVKK